MKVNNKLVKCGGQWVCAYYDTKSIFIYDSLGSQSLHPHHKIYLSRLFPNYKNKGIKILFPKVQKQPNSNDCGLFSRANAVTLFFNKNPQNMNYDNKKMRSHFFDMLRSWKISPFPLSKNISFSSISLAKNNKNIVSFT